MESRQYPTRQGMERGAVRQFRDYFQSMAAGRDRWHLYYTPTESLSGVTLAPQGDMPPESEVLVSDVSSMDESILRIKINAALDRRAWR